MYAGILLRATIIGSVAFRDKARAGRKSASPLSMSLVLVASYVECAVFLLYGENQP